MTPRFVRWSALWAFAALVVVLGVSTPGVSRATADIPSLHVVAAGDFNSTVAAAGVLDGMAAARPDMALALGDLSYGQAGQEQAWCDFVTRRVGTDMPFELLTGNHESDGRNGAIDAFAACLPNKLPGLVGSYGKEYYVDVPAERPLARFVMISPGISFAKGSPAWTYAKGDSHYTWTKAAIDGARAKGVPWVIVGMHKPCVSLGNYGCSWTSNGPGTDITNLLISKKVDLVLSGHEHLYQRTKQLRLSSTCTGLRIDGYNAACVKDGDATLAKGAGTTFLTVGTGGTPLRDVRTTDPEGGYHATYSAANASPSHGFLDLLMDAGQLRATFRATTGSYTDAFTLTTGRYVADEFERTVVNGWGSGAVGGTWLLAKGGSSSLAVTGGSGKTEVGIGAHVRVGAGPNIRDTDLRAVVTLDTRPTGSGYYLRSMHRLSSTGTHYAPQLKFAPDGRVFAKIYRVSGSGSTKTLRGYVQVPGVVYRAGMPLNIRSRVAGTSPATIKMKVWPVGTPEPAAWTVSASDSTRGYQGQGSWWLDGYLSSTASTPLTVTFDDVSLDHT